MRVALREYDFAAAEARLRSAIDRDAGIGVDDAYLQGMGLDNTRFLRELGYAPSVSPGTYSPVVAALAACASEACWLLRYDHEKGEGGGSVVDPKTVSTSHAAVGLLRRVRSHPSCPRTLTAVDRGSSAVVDRAGPLPWSVRDAIDDIVGGIRDEIGNFMVDSQAALWLPWRGDLLYEWEPKHGTILNCWMNVFATLVALDEFGAFDPGFTRGDVLAGDIWLIQPRHVGKDFWDYRQLAAQGGLNLLGFLPPHCVDVPGRLVMVCYTHILKPHYDRAERLQSAWSAGFVQTRWRRRQAPLDEPGFDLVFGADDAAAPFRSARELPDFPPPRWPWESRSTLQT